MINARPRFSKRSELAAFAASFMALVLLALVPFGRTLQLRVEPWLDPGTELFCFCCCLLLLSIYYLKLARKDLSLFAPHLLGVANLLLLCALTVNQTVEWMHPLLYAVLTGTALIASGKPSEAKARLWTLTYATIFSISDELLQGLDPGRVFDIRDLLINGWGILLGVLFAQPAILRAELES